MTKLATLQAQAIRLHKLVVKQTRRLREDRMKLGKLLIAIRDEIGIQNKNGSFRGSNNGVFCAWLESAGFNVGSVYNWMKLAATGTSGDAMFPSRKRIRYWQKFEQKMKRLEDIEARVTLFQQAVDHLRKTYRIPVDIQIKRQRALKAVA